jgi:hypothetical protein
MGPWIMLPFGLSAIGSTSTYHRLVFTHVQPRQNDRSAQSRNRQCTCLPYRQILRKLTTPAQSENMSSLHMATTSSGRSEVSVHLTHDNRGMTLVRRVIRLADAV